MEELIKMELHEVVQVNEFIKIIRVYGGWLYLLRTDDSINSTFVPYEK